MIKSTLTAAEFDLIENYVRDNDYIPITPTKRQALFLGSVDREVLFGGAAGGGKSEALLAAAAMFVSIPDYSALLLRRTFASLRLDGALIDRSMEWWTKTNAKWVDKEHKWQFPSGATITFGYLDSENDKYQYQSAEYQFVGFDETTQFTETQYRYLFSRTRRRKDSDIPIRNRAATNPGNIGHEWVKDRFIIPYNKCNPKHDDYDSNFVPYKGRFFIPSLLTDNPHLDIDDYLESLDELDLVERERLRNGDWDILPGGNMFKREWFRYIDILPKMKRMVRYWDMAATPEDKGKGTDPDWTVGLLMGLGVDGVYYVMDVVRVRNNPAVVEKIVLQTAQSDGRNVLIYMEEEPGSAGKTAIHHYASTVLLGYAFKGVRSSGNKITRAAPASTAVEHGIIRVANKSWTKGFVEECVVFPTISAKKDQVDGLSGAYEALITKTPVQIHSRRRRESATS